MANRKDDIFKFYLQNYRKTNQPPRNQHGGRSYEEKFTVNSFEHVPRVYILSSAFPSTILEFEPSATVVGQGRTERGWYFLTLAVARNRISLARHCNFNLYKYQLRTKGKKGVWNAASYTDPDLEVLSKPYQSFHTMKQAQVPHFDLVALFESLDELDTTFLIESYPFHQDRIKYDPNYTIDEVWNDLSYDFIKTYRGMTLGQFKNKHSSPYSEFLSWQIEIERKSGAIAPPPKMNERFYQLVHRVMDLELDAKTQDQLLHNIKVDARYYAQTRYESVLKRIEDEIDSFVKKHVMIHIRTDGAGPAESV